MRRVSLIRWLMAGLLGLSVALVASAGPIVGPAEFKRDTVAEFAVTAKGSLDVPIPAGLSVKEAPGKWYVAGKPGTYKLEGTDFWVDFDKKQWGREKVEVTFRILPADGEPPTPTPPGPTPPNPPGPTPPTPGTNPFTDGQPRVMILFDPFGPLPTAAQQAVFYGADSQAAMKAFAGDNVHVWPKGQTSSDPVWGAALKLPVPAYPWFVAGKGTAGLSEALPADAAAMKARLATLGAVATLPPAPVAWAEGSFPQSYQAPACRYMRLANGRLVTVCP